MNSCGLYQIVSIFILLSLFPKSFSAFFTTYFHESDIFRSPKKYTIEKNCITL